MSKKIELSKSKLTSFASFLKNQVKYLDEMADVREAYRQHLASKPNQEIISTEALDSFLDLQRRACNDAIAIGKVLEKNIDPDKKTVEKTEPTKTPVKVKKEKEAPVTVPKVSKKAEKEAQFISLFDF